MVDRNCFGHKHNRSIVRNSADTAKTTVTQTLIFDLLRSAFTRFIFISLK